MKYFISFCVSLFVVSINHAQIITTIAGTGNFGFSGDSAQAANAELAHPLAVITDAAGNIYITDQGNNRIRKINTAGIITTFAGTGEQGFSGEGGPAVNAKLGELGGIAADAAGNIFIADYGNHCIRKVDINGIITTVAGHGANEPADNLPATSVRLEGPTTVALDNGGNMYFPDLNAHAAYKVDGNGIITKIAGNGKDNSKDTGDGGPATAAGLESPTGIAVNSAGEIFITQLGFNRVRKIDKNGIITTIAGTGVTGYAGDGGMATKALLHKPYAVTAFGSDIFIADELNYAVRKVDAVGIITTVAGTGMRGYSGDGGLATGAKLSDIGAVTIDKNGTLLIADFSNNCIRRVTGVTLPITLALFTGQLNNNNTLLQWQTATELNSKLFNILRSEDGTNFKNIGTVNASGGSTGAFNYTYTDVNVTALKTTRLFYKLQCVDKDGSSTYSKTIRLQLDALTFSILAYPNPTKNLLYIRTNEGYNKLKFSVFDAFGRRLAIVWEPGSDNTIRFNTGGLKAGVYVISAIVNGRKYEQKFIKE